MLNTYRYLCSTRNYTPTNFSHAVGWEAKKHHLTKEKIYEMVGQFDRIVNAMLETSHEVTELGTTYDETDEYDTNRTTRYLIEFKHPQTVGDVQLLADYYYPETRCCHEYDCCGHWYNSWPKVKQIGPCAFRVSIGEYQNV